jgi:asparagine synthase (glutamine-hydrolysing)
MTEPPRHCFVGLTAARQDADAVNRLRETVDKYPADVVSSSTVTTASWGTAETQPGSGRAAPLCAFVRRHEVDQSTSALHQLLASSSHEGLGEVLPTFGAVTWRGDDELCATTDVLGFRHIYQANARGWSGVSTSANILAALGGMTFDHEALAVQSQLGWQLGQRTLFGGVRKTEPGTLISLTEGRASTETFAAEPAHTDIPLDTAVSEAAHMLRTYMNALLDDHPDAILQLTGGLDSRILLSAIPVARRKGLRVVTLGVPGVPDLEIAADLAARYGMRHETLSLQGLDELSQAEAYRRCVAAATDLDCTADPLAYASLWFAESRAEAGTRISGLGGEVARGFYYHGVPHEAPVTPKRSRRLAAWRMFTNEAVETLALDPEFYSWGREFALNDVHRTLASTGRSWFRAVDELYLGQRMQRWGGITETSVCTDRRVANPMLDDRFLTIARRLSPRDKRNVRFLSRLVLTLDPDLAAIPMDGRPPPAVYAKPSLRRSTLLLESTASKARKKAIQRIRRVNLPPAGAEILAESVLGHFRSNPAILEPVQGLGIFKASWLDELVSGAVTPRTSSLAFLVNVLVAQNAGSS